MLRILSCLYLLVHGAAMFADAAAEPAIHAITPRTFPSASEGIAVRRVEGSSVTLVHYRMEPEAILEADGDDMGGAVAVVAGEGELLSPDGGAAPFLFCDSMTPDGDSPFIFRAGDDGAELAALHVPVPTDGAGFPSGPIAGRVVDYRTLPFIFPEEGAGVRMAGAYNGALSFVRQFAWSTVAWPAAERERLFMVIRGWCVTGGNGERLPPGSVVALPPGETLTLGCGPEGVEAAVFARSADPLWTSLLDERTRLLSTIIEPGTEPELVTDGTGGGPELHVTEGPSWMNGMLYFSDYGSGRRSRENGDRDRESGASGGRRRSGGGFRTGGVHAVQPDGSHILVTDGIVTCGTTPLPNGNLAVCDIRENRVAEIRPDGAFVRTLAETFDGVPFGMPNDLITDSRGGLYFTVSRVREDDGDTVDGTSVYYLNRDEKLLRLTGWDEFAVPNGCLVSADNRTFYLACSREPTIWRFDITADGSFSGKRPFAVVVPHDNPRDRDRGRGIADGMTIDTAGNVYVATCHGIWVLDSGGSFIGTIHVPVSPAHCVFGGDDMSTLYVTSRDHVYSIRLKTRGYRYPIR